MTIEPKDGKIVLEAVQSAVKRYGASQDELIPILNDVNREIGYLPGEALDEVSRLLKVPKSQLFSVASFYRMLSTKPRGKHVIQFCESAPCHVAGGREVWTALKEALKGRMASRLNDWDIVEETRSSFVFRMKRCRVQFARKRQGLDDYPCKSGGTVEYRGFAWAVDPAVRMECVACPPDPHPEAFSCAWKFSLPSGE